MSSVFLADTYALIEIITGNPNYETFLHKKLITTDFVLVEFYYYCLRYYGEEFAKQQAIRFSALRTRVTLSTIAFAAQLRLEHKKENLSYADCAGWALAQQLGVPFLTGDKAFADKPGVAFVR